MFPKLTKCDQCSYVRTHVTSNAHSEAFIFRMVYVAIHAIVKGKLITINLCVNRCGDNSTEIN